MNTTNELIYFKKEYSGEYGDFSGKEEAFCMNERIEFLKRYSDFQKKVHNLKEYSTKAVEQSEITQTLKRIDYEVVPKIRQRIEMSEMDASLLKKTEVFAGWQLYTKRTTVQDGAICFNDAKKTPIPCAKYTFTNGEKLTRVQLKIFISKEYKKPRKSLSEQKIPLATTTGRIFELRSGIEEILKIQFYASGEVCARIGVSDIYHHKNILLGKYKFDEWNTLTLELNENSYNVELNGEKTENLIRSSTCAPDTLFLSGGFHPRGKWKVKPEKFVYAGEETGDFFKAAKKTEFKEVKIGRVKIPYAVGGYKNRDNYLILRKDFYAPQEKRAVLTVDSLDPGGWVELNGAKVLETDTFMLEKIDVTSFLKEGKNTLKIVVEPRAPEVLYSWHRCKDQYNGWFCNEVALEFFDECHVESIDVETKRIEAGKAEIALRVKTHNAAGKALKIYMSRTNPTKGEESLIYSGKAENNALFSLKIEAEPWSADNPVLYALRVQLENENGVALDDYIVETGFRTIEQKNGEILLNSEKTLLRGALLMQFLPPYENIGISHVCPKDEELAWQFCLLKGMNANLARLHMLGYGTNDKRYARFCDRMGLMLIWTTRYIDSVESVQWGTGWEQGELYVQQIKELKNNPSIIIWEGSNEYRAAGDDIDWLYDEFVSYVKKADTTRLLSPCSHLYYGGGIPGGGYYYQDDGKLDQDFQPAESSFGWLDDLVIRSAHPYYATLGYGTKWDAFREQKWKTQKGLFESKNHAYLATEIAITGRHDDTTPESQEYVNNDSYELSCDKAAIGREFEQSEWRISQAYQALAASKAIQFLRVNDADGIAWCSLTGGANDASYWKPAVDFYGYAKYAYYTLKENYAETIAFNENTAVMYGERSVLQPCVVGAKPNATYLVCVRIYDETDGLVDEKVYENVQGDGQKIALGAWVPKWKENGYYRISYQVTEV